MLFDMYPTTLKEQLVWAPWREAAVLAGNAAHVPSDALVSPPNDDDDTGALLFERSRTRLSTSHITATTPATDRSQAASLSSTPPLPSRLSMKVATHLRDGVAVVLACAPFDYWTGHVTVEGLQAALTTAYPSVRLPDKDLLSAVEETLQDAQARHFELRRSQHVCAETLAATTNRTSKSKNNTSRSAATHVASGHMGNRTEDHCEGVWVAHLVCPLNVLRDYHVDLEVAITCVPLRGCDACGTRVRERAAARRFFYDMVYAPQQARLLALSELLLLVNVPQGTERGLDESVRRVSETYRTTSTTHIQQRIQHEAREQGGSSSLEQSWEAERTTTADALQLCFGGLAMPAPVSAIAPLADGLLRLARREEADSVFAARPISEAQHPTTGPPLTSDLCRGESAVAAAARKASAISTRDPKRERSPVASSTAQATVNDTATAVPGASSASAADGNDARKKKIRRLFS